MRINTNNEDAIFNKEVFNKQGLNKCFNLEIKAKTYSIIIETKYVM